MKRYRVDNWPEYTRALINRGSLTVWVEDGALQSWLSKRKTGKRGRPQKYSDEAILMLLVVRQVYHLPLRALQGFVTSIFLLMGLDLPVPYFTQVSRRSKGLHRKMRRPVRGKLTDVVFDSTGLKVYGEGEWKVRSHGTGKRRHWKKLHICIDPHTQEILMSELTDCSGGDSAVATKMVKRLGKKIGSAFGDGAYDDKAFRSAIHRAGGEAIVPPPKNATYKGAEHGWERERDLALAEICALGGDGLARAVWKKLRGYHQRSLVETAMYRIKHILGERLRSRCNESQRVESECKVLIINTMTKLGMPAGQWE